MSTLSPVDLRSSRPQQITMPAARSSSSSRSPPPYPTPGSDMSSTPFLKPEERSPSPDSPHLKPAIRLNGATPRKFRIKPLTLILIGGILIILVLPFAHPKPRELVTEYLASNYITTDLSISHIAPPSGQIPDHLHVPLTLEARLSYLLSRPALYQWEAELPSRHACPFYTYNRNTYFFHEGKPEQWEKVGPTEIKRYRKKIVDWLRDVERQGGKLVWEEGMDDHVPKDMRRGIIMAAGDGKRMDRLKLSLHMLRNVFRTKLPIELYHFPDEMQDENVRTQISDEFDVIFREVDGRNDRTFEAWNIKTLSFLASDFTEFIYIDSDNIPLADPAELFDSVEYQQSGSVFWADLNKDHPDNAIFRIMGRDCTDDHWPAEAGQLVFDKRANNGLNLAVLHLANMMMTQDDMYGFLSYGDKDTFRYSFYALGLPYQQAPRLFASAGGYQDEAGQDGDFCGHSMIQWGLTPKSKRHDPSYHPKPAFLHTILAKHRQGLQVSKLFSHIKKPRLDGIHESRLVRTYYEWTGKCFEITLKGPDGMPGVENSVMDGQGVIYEPMGEVLGDERIWDELQMVAERFVAINDAKEG